MNLQITDRVRQIVESHGSSSANLIAILQDV